MRERHLFRLAYAVLALAFWVSVAGFAYLMTRPHHSKQLAWSAWKPKHQDLDGAREIGQHVSHAYRFDDGRQLVAVQEHPNEVQGLRLEAIGVRRLQTNGVVDRYIALYPGRRTLIYAFCGLGRNCSVAGRDNDGIDRLLRREALELTLYAFKYLHGLDQVVSLLPPSPATGGEGTDAVFIRDDTDFRKILKHPLREILPRATPPAPSQLDAKEAAVVDALTRDRTFPAQFEPLPDGDAILVLQSAAGA
jgi:hypothetical protein